MKTGMSLEQMELWQPEFVAMLKIEKRGTYFKQDDMYKAFKNVSDKYGGRRHLKGPAPTRRPPKAVKTSGGNHFKAIT